jgi:MoaA/NifB/PqqE/SkfB family radical SAM enzyme
MEGTHVPVALTFNRAPLRVYWEITRACSLACRHCRAEAAPEPEEGELTPQEGRALLFDIARFGDPKPKVILTGGDPLERKDLFDLIDFARSLGLGVSVSPSATPRLTPEAVRRFSAAGVEAISLSLDAASAEHHDSIRGSQGCYGRTLAAARVCAEVGLPVQVNTLVCEETVDELPAVYELVKSLQAARWSLFFLVTVGRGTELHQIDRDTVDQVLTWLANIPSGQLPVVTTTEAPFFRRVQLERRLAKPATSARSGFGVRDGNGVMFVSNTGDVSPSGFLPMAAGNVRSADVVEIYRASPLFTALRDASGFGGRCGACAYQFVCGGSRARAWTATGDPLAEDPLCHLPVLQRSERREVPPLLS